MTEKNSMFEDLASGGFQDLINDAQTKLQPEIS